MCNENFTWDPEPTQPPPPSSNTTPKVCSLFDKLEYCSILAAIPTHDDNNPVHIIMIVLGCVCGVMVMSTVLFYLFNRRSKPIFNGVS